MLRIVLTLSEYRLKITVFKQRAINKPRYISTYSVSIVRSSWNWGVNSVFQVGCLCKGCQNFR